MTRRSDPATLPVLDILRLDAGRAAFLNELRHAARPFGFFYLDGQGIANDLIRSDLTLSRRFFALPERDKLAIEMVNSPHFRGYNRAGFERTRSKPDWREQVDIGIEREALAFDPGAPAWRPLQGPNQRQEKQFGNLAMQARDIRMRTKPGRPPTPPSLVNLG
jgi:isopenicillin N synthase-like dioxygenase